MDWIKKFLNLSISKKQVKQYIKRAPRIKLKELEGIHFSAPNFGLEKVKLYNLSSTGVGFINSKKDKWAKKGTPIEGTFIFGENVFDVSMSIVHTNEDVIGCAFLSDTKEVVKFIKKYFTIELQALQLIEVDDNCLNPALDGKPKWFMGNENFSLYFIYKEEKLVRFNLVFMGSELEGKNGRLLKFTPILEEENYGSKYNKESEIFVSDYKIPQGIFEEIERFIFTIPTLKHEFKEQLIDYLKANVYLE
ncbi:MAG: hypothetical protein H7A23_00900 [Leptospiraceae bacterium]|nr:hypothetical protein [Leptospiraceae bacterium]MCP5493088.1 hypothetical protein [Leptospiraceae bacterium]